MPSEAVQRVLDRLEVRDCMPRGNVERGWYARCPSHDDRTPSFKLDQGVDGKALVFCHAGCTLDQIAAGLQTDVRELFEPDPDQIEKIVVERYDYTDERGELLFQVERLSPKSFRQRRPGRGGWEYSLGDVRRVLYRLPQVIKAVKAGKLVCVVEGERDVHTLERKGQVATTCPGGAGKWRDHYAEVLRGARVAVIQDVDDPGKEHAEQVRKSLEAVGATVKVLQPAVGKDVSDHVKAGMKLGQLLSAEAERQGGLLVMACRKIMQLPDPSTEGYLLGPLVYRGHRIVVGGWTGHGKTTFTLRMTAAACYGRDFLQWHGRGDLRALVVDVEQGQRTIKRRITEAGLEESDRVEYLRVPDGLALDRDEDAIAAMERIFLNGHYDLVLLDPLYKLTSGDPNDARSAVSLMRRFDDWRERYEFSLILPMHCRKPLPNSRLSPHDLFGSSAWQWGAEMLLGIERKSDKLTWLHWWKDREGEVSEEGAAVGTHWELLFNRDEGYRRWERKAPAVRFDLPGFILQMIRGNGTVTRSEVKDSLWQQRRAYTMEQIDRALGALEAHGVTHNGAKLKKDRLYQLPESMLEDGGAPA